MRLRHLNIIVMLVFLSGCAGTSVFYPYPVQAEAYKSALINTSSGTSTDVLSSERTFSGPDALLHHLELARVQQLNGNYTESINHFESAIELFEKEDLQATLRLSGVAEQGTSMLLNDNSLEYHGAPHERIFSHLYQAMNYLALANAEAAAVEFRKLALEQRIQLEQHESDIAKAESRLAHENIDIDDYASQLNMPLDRLSGELKNAFQNAYAFYLSAIFWEAQGDLNRARIDYLKVAELKPELSFIHQDIERVSTQLNTLSWAGSGISKGQGTVLVVLEQGFVPAKKEVHLAFPVGEGRLFSMALPSYSAMEGTPLNSLIVRDEQGSLLGSSEEILNVAELVLKHYQEQIPVLLLRQALRAVAKHRFQEVSQDKMGLAGLFAANVFSLLSERADLRSWLTLPQQIQLVRLSLKQGEYGLELRLEDHVEKIRTKVKSGQTLVIRVFEANNQFKVQQYML